MMTTITTNVRENFYCSQKFWWLSVDLEKLQSLSCCAATPAKINFDYLKQNPGELFNSPNLVSERQDMLENKQVESCSATCWKPEANSLTSRRLMMNSVDRTHVNVNTVPEILHIILGTDCNMSCVYCCKTYSSSWAKDLADNGPYSVETADDRFNLSSRDRVIMQLSQKDIGNGQFNKVLIDEIEKICQNSNLKEIVITGGEPFLHLELSNLISRLKNTTVPIKIWSGLGVNSTRFEKEIKKLQKFSNIEIVISAEATGELYELLRYGNTWEKFQENVTTLDRLSINHSFYSTVTNLTLFGIKDFILYAGKKQITYSLCTDPSFLSVNVLDLDSKQYILDIIDTYPEQLQKILAKDLSLDATGTDNHKLKTYLLEFATRRDINLDFLPKTFKKWVL